MLTVAVAMLSQTAKKKKTVKPPLQFARAAARPKVCTNAILVAKQMVYGCGRPAAA